jgi:hypothetical protein
LHVGFADSYRRAVTALESDESASSTFIVRAYCDMISGQAPKSGSVALSRAEPLSRGFCKEPDELPALRLEEASCLYNCPDKQDGASFGCRQRNARPVHVSNDNAV